MVGKAFEQLGGLDLLVNDAAYQQSKADILEITDEQFDRTFETNVYHVFRFSKAAIPHLPPGASIINTVSVNSYNPGEELIDYAATKAAILNLIKGMVKQLAKKGIGINSIAPGLVWTPMLVTGGQLEGQMKEFG